MISKSKKEKSIRIVLSLLLVVSYTLTIFVLSSYANKTGIIIDKNNYLNFQVNYQLLLISLALVSLFITYFFNPRYFKKVMSTGNISAKGNELKIFGIKKGDSWLKTGISLSLVISLVTGTFMFFQLKNHSVDYALLKDGLIWIIIFSITNSFSEEMIFRVGINVPLYNLLQPRKIFLISAVIFGTAHYYGMPNGIIGVVLSGLLGYILSKSLYETNGIFWAWFIHFIQDVIIISSLFLLSF